MTGSHAGKAIPGRGVPGGNPTGRNTGLRSRWGAVALLLMLGLFPLFSCSKEEAPSLEIMAGQMILAGFRGTGEAPLTRDLEVLLEDIALGRVGGVILFEPDYLTGRPGRNITSVEQTAALAALLQSRSRIPLFIAVDQEGGRVRRFKEEHGVAGLPSAEEMGKGDPRETGKAAFALGIALKRAGVNLNFAPGVDVNVNPACPAIGALGRSFSNDEERVAEHGRAFAEGLIRAGVLAAYKHFPGHGSATDDTHAGMADITRTFEKRELVPYRRLLKPGVPVMVMAGHMVHRGLDEELPASLSPAVINGLLRSELGWRGVVITDDLHMQAILDHYDSKEAIALAVEAGVDILLLGNNLRHDPEEGRKAHALLLELVREGRLTRERVAVSYERIMSLKDALGDPAGRLP